MSCRSELPLPIIASRSLFLHRQGGIGKKSHIMKYSVFFSLIVLPLFLFQGFSYGNTISFEEYRSRLRQALESAKSAEGALKPEEVTRQKDLFPPGIRVRTWEGEEESLNREDLLRWVEEADRSTRGRQSLVRHLESLATQVGRERTSIPWTDQAWKDSRKRLETLYRMEEFRGLEEKEPLPWLASLIELLDRVGKWFERAFRAVEARMPGQWINYLFYGLVFVAAAFLVCWIIRNFGPAGWRWRSGSGKSAPSEKKAEMDYRPWRRKAMDKASEGAFREAVRFFFLSVLLEGHHHGWWTYTPEATNREHLARVGGPSERRDAMKQLTALYEKVWYGKEEAGKEAFQHCSEWLKRMEAAL